MLENVLTAPTPSTSPSHPGGRAVVHKTTLELLEVAARFQHPAAVAALLEACIIESDGDAVLIAKALGAVVHAQGMRDFSERSGMSCRLLRRELSGRRSPQFATILQVARTLGITLHVSAA